MTARGLRRTGVLAVAAAIGLMIAVGGTFRLGDDPIRGVHERAIGVEAPVTLRMLSVSATSQTNLAITDLATGTLTTYEPSVHGLSREPFAGGVLTDDGAVIWLTDGSVHVYADGLAGPSLIHTPADLDRSTSPSAAPAVSVLPAVDDEAMWVVQPGNDCCGDERPGQAELVHMGTGEVRLATDLPPNSHPAGALPGGLVLNTLRFTQTPDGWVGQEGSHAVLVLGDDGSVTELSAGEAAGAVDESVAVLECGDQQQRTDCELVLVDATTGERTDIQKPAAGNWTSLAAPNMPTATPPWATARDGRLLLGLVELADERDEHDPAGRIVMVDARAEGGPTASVVHEFHAKSPSAAWDFHGTRIVIADAGSTLVVVDPRAGTSFTVDGAIPANHYLIGMR